MFKKFIKRIVACENRDEAIEKVFYGADGIDMHFRKKKFHGQIMNYY